jgi:non-heme chloroperoxidase
LFEKLNLNDAIMVGHFKGGREAARYLGRHGAKRVSNAVLISSVPPLMLKTEKIRQACLYRRSTPSGKRS